MTSAAAQIVRMIRMVRSFAEAPPFVIHHLLTASIMHLLNATTQEPGIRTQSVNRFRVCVGALEEMTTRWKCAKKSVKLLRGLAQRWKVVFALPIHLSSPLSCTTQEAADHLLSCGLTLNDNADQDVSHGEADGHGRLDDQFELDLTVNGNALWDFSEWPDLNQALGLD
jgi:hypothetical protein